MSRRILSLLFILVFGLILATASTRREETRRYDHTDGLASPIVGGGVQDRLGLLWFATWNGLDCYDGYEFHHVRIHAGDGSSASSNHIRDISLLPDGFILCHTEDGIHRFSLEVGSFQDVSERDRAEMMRKVGRTWHGMTDAQGNRWSADLTGLYKRTRVHHPASLLEGTQGQEARALMLDSEGRLWAGFRNSKRVAVFGDAGELLREELLQSSPYVIFQRRNGDVWVGCKPGLLQRIDGPALASEAVYDIAEDAEGRLWIATFGGGVRCCPAPDAAVPRLSDSFGGRRVRKILATPAGRIVAATTEGLLIGEIDTADWRRTRLRSIRRDGRRASSLASNAVMSLARDSQGNIYIGTESSGVDRIAEDALFSDNPEFEHLPPFNPASAPDICNALALSGDTLLMIVGTDRVAALNTATLQSVSFNRSFWSDSCRFEEVTPVRFADGSWAFAAREGVLLATHHNLYTRGYCPPLVFTTLAKDGGEPEFSLPARDTIFLSPHERNVTVGFAALDYGDNSGIIYRTRLDGSPWSAPGAARSVTLFNLSPSAHTLEVQSTDRYGRWVDNARALTIIVAPRWYETWWARTAGILLAAGLLGGAVWTAVYIRRIDRQRKELLDKYMAAVSERTLPAGDTASETPDMPPLTPEQKPEDTLFLNRVRDYIERNLDNRDANVDAMAEAAAVSRSTLNRRLRQLMGVSAAQLLIETRLTRAAQLLAQNDSELQIADVAMRCGYPDQQYFQRAFRKRFGLSPADYRIEHDGQKTV